jgi:hypothetical protein
LQGRSLVAQRPDFPSQTHHCFGQYTHVCPRFPNSSSQVSALPQSRGMPKADRLSYDPR